ncbi:hypothetical protein B0H13DRAFT_2364711 [Mycena leptocephala]|nr:hypothetical protein B0H13DRAFT_2364711 [Mycena leptocephala]
MQPDGSLQNQAPAGSGGPDAGSGQHAPNGGNQQGAQSAGNSQDRALAGSSGPSAGGDGGAPQGPNQGLPAAAQSALSDCELIVEEYWCQRISKAKALQEIYQKLIGAGVGGDLDMETAFSSFLKAVDDVDHQHNSAADHGHAHGPTQGQGDAAPGVRRSLSPPVLERLGGRSSALEAQYPWAVTEFIESSIQPLSPNLTETLRILKVLLQDPKIAKHSILTSANAPGFPDAEWTNLVNGCSINLDAVLSGMFSTSTTDERSEALSGGFELRFGAVAPTKLVSDAGTWTIVFDHLRAATLFVFPHRAQELDGYKWYIVGLFAAMHSSFQNLGGEIQDAILE